MKKNLFFLAIAMTIFTITTAFVLNTDSPIKEEATKAPVDLKTTNSFGLNLDKSGDVRIVDNDLFLAEVKKMVTDAGFDLEIKNVIPQEAKSDGEFTSKSFLVQYADDSDEHVVSVTYLNSSYDTGIVPVKLVPICVDLGCTSGCNPQISSTGVFSCTACKGPWYSSCSKISVPAI